MHTVCEVQSLFLTNLQSLSVFLSVSMVCYFITFYHNLILSFVKYVWWTSTVCTWVHLRIRKHVWGQYHIRSTNWIGYQCCSSMHDTKSHIHWVGWGHCQLVTIQFDSCFLAEKWHLVLHAPVTTNMPVVIWIAIFNNAHRWKRDG
jgi:hypothetical protein